MGVYYPQASLLMRIRWEDFGDDGQADLKEVYDLPIVAKRVSVNINDYTTADTFDVEIDYKNFPFDPRTIRAVGVTVAMEDVGKVFNLDNSLDAIRPRRDVTGKDGNVIPGNVVFMGFADEESLTFDDQSRVVKFEGRDFTGLLIDTKYLLGAIPLDQPVDVVLTNILASLESTKEIILDNRVVDDTGALVPLPILSSFWAEQDLLAGKRSAKKDESYWDVIQDIVARAGLIAYIELDHLVLSKPRILYAKTKKAKFVYGKNIKSLEFKRKIGRKRNFNVVVRSLNMQTKTVDLARIPAEATDEWSKATGISNVEVTMAVIKPGGTSFVEQKQNTNANGQATSSPPGLVQDAQVAPYISFRVADVQDHAHLIEVGQGIYEELGRQQIEGSFSTKEMATADSSNSFFSLLQLRNGTPVNIEMDQGDMKQFNSIKVQETQDKLSDQRKLTEARARFLVSRGYSQKVAHYFAETFGKFTTPFYTKDVTFSIDASQGFECKVNFINFIEVSNKALAGIK